MNLSETSMPGGALRRLEGIPAANIGLRVLLALAGGYGLALLAASALAAGLPFDNKPDAVSLAIMLAFLLHLGAILWVFACATLARAVLGLAIPAALFGLWRLLLGGI